MRKVIISLSVIVSVASLGVGGEVFAKREARPERLVHPKPNKRGAPSDRKPVRVEETKPVRPTEVRQHFFLPKLKDSVVEKRGKVIHPQMKRSKAKKVEVPPETKGEVMDKVTPGEPTDLTVDTTINYNSGVLSDSDLTNDNVYVGDTFDETSTTEDFQESRPAYLNDQQAQRNQAIKQERLGSIAASLAD